MAVERKWTMRCTCSTIGALTFSIASPANAQTIQVVCSNVATSSTSTLTGARDLAGLPVAAKWRRIQDLAVRQDGAQWCAKGLTTQSADLETVLVMGTGLASSVFLQEGQAVQGGAAGELYDLFDPPQLVSWNSHGDIALSFRARGGLPGTLEKLGTFIGGVHAVVRQESDGLTGLADAGAVGDERVGSVIDSVQLRDDGSIFYLTDPVQGCAPQFASALCIDGHGFRQSAASTIGPDVWERFESRGCGATPSGTHWFARGDSANANTAIDEVLVVDDTIVLQEGSPAASGGPLVQNIFHARMLASGSWFARGDAPALDDWAVRDGALLAKSGALISGAEHWASSIIAVHGNSSGHWVIAGTTDAPTPLVTSVLAYDGTHVLLRSGEPLAIDNDGLFDDDAFVMTFGADSVFLTEDGVVWAHVLLSNAAVTSFYEAVVRIPLALPDGVFCRGDGLDLAVTTACPCGNTGSAGNGCANSVVAGGAHLSASGTQNPDTIVLAATGTPASALSVYLQGDALVDAVFGDGVRCAGGALLRLRTRASIGGTSSFPDASDTITLSARGGVVPGSGATRLYQTYYRNAASSFCPPATFNVTNGWRLTW